jgi:hypothetical protein
MDPVLLIYVRIILRQARITIHFIRFVPHSDVMTKKRRLAADGSGGASQFFRSRVVNA